MTTPTSLPQRAKLNDIVKNLFQNEVIKSDGMKEFYTFSNLHLTGDQVDMLEYQPGFIPMNIYILQQVDSYLGDVFTSSISFVSFVKNGDGFIYGYYFDVNDQPRFEIEELTDSKNAITLSPGATFKPTDLLEVYNNVLGIT